MICINRWILLWLIIIGGVCAISNVGPTCFRCSREVLPTTCSNVVTCGPHELCAIEKGVDLLGNAVFWSGCKSKPECSARKKRSSPVDVLVTCSECCDGNFCNAKGCGETGFPTDGNRLCFNCLFMDSPSNCSRVVQCQKDEVCYLEESVLSDTTVYRSGCRVLQECKEQRPCGGCCLGNYCNSGCTPYDNLRPPYHYVTITNSPDYIWITVPYQK
ncbi:uncharacterized protein LOC111137028 [Crassostrea virginica]